MQWVDKTDPLSQATQTGLQLAVCPKSFQRIDGPSKSLLATPSRPFHCPELPSCPYSSHRPEGTSQSGVVTMRLLFPWDGVVWVSQVDRIPTDFHHPMQLRLSFSPLLLWIRDLCMRLTLHSPRRRELHYCYISLASQLLHLHEGAHLLCVTSHLPSCSCL